MLNDGQLFLLFIGAAVFGLTIAKAAVTMRTSRTERDNETFLRKRNHE